VFEADLLLGLRPAPATEAATACCGHVRRACANTCGWPCAQELVARQETFLPAGEFDALKGAVLGELEVRSRFKPPGATRCLFCIHVIFNTAGAQPLLTTSPGSACACAGCAACLLMSGLSHLALSACPQ
jgi:hypothetical protein